MEKERTKQEFLQMIETIKENGIKYIGSNLQEDFEELDYNLLELKKLLLMRNILTILRVNLFINIRILNRR